MAAAAPQLKESERFGYLKPKDVARLEDAYRFSEAAHAGQTRQSGEPYISHPLAVAEILADWHLDGQTLMAALLHDVTEDTSVTNDEISDTFGKPVAELVDGVSKLDRIEFQSAEDAQAENFRKMLLAMARSILRKFSACASSALWNSMRSSLETPSTSSATGLPKVSEISSLVTEVSSVTSCSSAAISVCPSRCQSARISATARGCEMYGSPDCRVCPACAASEKR